MAAPLSLERVKSALRAVWPAWPAFDAHGVAEEAALMSTLFGRIVDRVDAFSEELWPDGASEDLERWERIWKVPPRAPDLAARQARLCAVIGRLPGSTVQQLCELLAPAFGFTNPSDVNIVEVEREQVEAAMTARQEFGGGAGLVVPNGQSLIWHVPAAWPGKVDDVGVSLTIDYECTATFDATVSHADGTSWSWQFDDQNSRARRRYWKRGIFDGKRAAGPWEVRLDVNDGDPATIWAVELMVSNDEDGQQIYYLYAQRDPTLPGAEPDLVEALRLLLSTAHAHYRRYVCERTMIICNDPRSLCDRDVIGS